MTTKFKVIRGRDQYDLVNEFNKWLEDGKTIHKITLDVDDSQAYSHTLRVKETPRTVKTIVEEKVILKEVIKYHEHDRFDGVENLEELAHVLGLNASEFAWELGLANTRSVREFHIRTHNTQRKYALEMKNKWGIDYEHALKLIKRPKDWSRMYDEKH